jgi:hypothetical protein
MDIGLEKQKMSLDAYHFNPTTMAQIHQDGGLYLAQAEENLNDAKLCARSRHRWPRRLGMTRRTDVSPRAVPNCSPWYR